MVYSMLTHRRPRRGFTLIELLVVIMILGILASIVSLALVDSLQEARIARTRAQIQKINELLMIHWESYRTRPVQLKMSNYAPEQAAKVKLLGLRELMRMELPDRRTDVSDGPVYLNGRPSMSWAYNRRVSQIGGFAAWSPEHQQAECLYLILASMQDGTRSGLDFFRDNEIGDVDSDGMPEILDGWGRPIRFLRWAPGFSSPLQDPDDMQPDPFDPLRVDPRWKNNSVDDRHYPSDRPGDYPTGAPPPGAALDDPFQLFPLVFSAGPDGLYHIVLDIYGTLGDDDYVGGVFCGGAAVLRYTNTDGGAYANYTMPAPYPPPAWPTKALPPTNWYLWSSSPKNDPYVILPGCDMRIGGRYPLGGAEDNIDNQTLVVR